ncbi:MAG TPA: GH25 family lysozyme [Bacteroidia bacterium]|nr:GH25 family lysozyme [Bacteroidia bacterium]
MVKGFDCSHQNDLNWNNISPDVKFIYHKATQGGSFKDPAFNQRWQHLKTTDLLRGAYHFLTATNTAQEQADNFLSLGIDFSKPGVLPPMIDIEDQVPASLNSGITQNKPAFIQLATDWINIVEAATKRKVVIYSYKNFFAEYLNNHSWPNNPLWLASYQAEQPGLPIGYNSWQFWQYSQYGKISGEAIGGDLDLDYFNGTFEQLQAL